MFFVKKKTLYVLQITGRKEIYHEESMLYKQGYNVKTTATYLGHSVEVMLRIYSHIDKKVKPENVKDIDQIFRALRA